MKKVILVAFFIFIPVFGTFSQSMTVFEHSNSFEDITELFQIRAKEISLEFNYFSSGFQSNISPVLSEKDKNIVGEDKFAVLWIEAEMIDLNILFLFNMKTNEAIIFVFHNEYMEGHVPCSLLEMSGHLIYHIMNVYDDPNWYQKPELQR